jgi:SAM-dependent methyltransferase
MDSGEEIFQEPDSALVQYLQSWGLQEFHDEVSYYEWQRDTLSEQDLRDLQAFVEQRQGGENIDADIQFYDFLAAQPILSVIYSQRFDYFVKVGSLISPRVSSTEHVLDFGCGVGILTCWYAQQHPHTQFVGVDRSTRSIAMARDEAEKRHLHNVQFHVIHNASILLDGVYDCILSTQALLQSEREPGLPSRSWRTFERIGDRSQQEALEERTDLAIRLQVLLKVLTPAGRLLCFEKTLNPGRRIFFQRALSGRNLFPISEPISCSYLELGDMRVDGPLYEVSRVPVPKKFIWHEDPFHSAGETLYRSVGLASMHMSRELDTTESQETVSGQHATLGPWSVRFGVWEGALAWGLCEVDSGFCGLLLAGEGERDLIFQLGKKIRNMTDSDFEEWIQDCWGHLRDAHQNQSNPVYENHCSSAQAIYESLPRKIIQQESTFVEGKGREMHIEVGTTNTLQYFYWANTFDQRQLVLMDQSGAEILREYYQESLETAQDSS